MTREPILIVDDNAANLKVARFALEGEGYQVWTASDAEEALDRLDKFRPRLILMDIQLPGMNGLELTRLLKGRPATRDIVIVAVTAYAMMGDRERALSAGCDGYITKPLDPIRLPVQLAEYLAKTDNAAASNVEKSDPGVAGDTPDFRRHEATGSELLAERTIPDGTKQIVLIVEDNPATCRMYRLSLESAGYDVVDARDGRAALDALNYVKPALIIQDLVLPDMDGMELARTLRRKLAGASVPLLCVSGFLLPADETRAVESGFTQVLTKPLDPFHLLDAVKSQLASAQGIDEPVGEGRLLLIVDDDPLQRRLAQMWFAGAGFRVIAAGSAKEALQMAEAERPAAVVSDVLMPGMDGFALCRNMRKDPSLARVPVILTSLAYTEQSDRELATRVGATALLPKEGGLEAVTRAVANALKSLSNEQSGESAQPVSEQQLEEEHERRRAAQLDRQVQENNSLLRRTVLHQAQLAALAGVADALAKNVLADAVLGDVLGACLDMAGVSKGALYIAKGERLLELKHHIGFSESGTQRLRAKLGHPDLFTDVMNTASVTMVPGGSLDRDIEQQLMIGAGVTSLLLVPVTAGVKTSGVMLLGARSADVSDQNAREFGRVLGALMGQALALAQAFEKLGASELRYRTLTENANDAICILAMDGAVREVNRRLTEITGYPAEYFIGRRMSDFASAVESGEGVPESVLGGAEETGPARRYRLRKRNGDTALIDFSNARIEIESETVVFSIGRDVTDQVRAQAQLMVSDRMVSLGMLAAGLAHEVNNPLHAVLGNLELASEAAEEFASSGDISNLASLREALSGASEAGNRIRQIVKDLKIFSRADKTEESFRRPVDLKVLLQSTLRMAVNETRHRARVVERYGNTPLVDANESRLGQVFLNLIVNAAQAIAEGHADVNEIRISTGNDPSGRVVVEIADSGHGISPAALRHLFTPFTTTKSADVGTGLGLTICRQIVAELDGEITVESQIGVGSTFRVFLNKSPETQLPGVSGVLNSSPTRRGNVLVIDDDTSIGRTFRLVLSRDHDVTVFSNARDALSAINGGSRFDVILCDIMMPVMTGPDFFEELQKTTPDQAERIVFVTGGVFTDGARDFLDRVPNACLEKPITTKRLRHEVDTRVL